MKREEVHEMAVQLTIPYETLVELVEQLPPEQQENLLQRILTGKRASNLTRSERVAAYRASIMSVPLREEPSIRREDWYGDDGR